MMIGSIQFYSRFNPNRLFSILQFQSNYYYAYLIRFRHYTSVPGFVSSDSFAFNQNGVALFWDLDSKHPKSVSPYTAAVRLKAAASSFGVVRHMVAYANRHASIYVPPAIRKIERNARKDLNQLEGKGICRPAQPYLCRVCWRKFRTNEKPVKHFKQLHQREQMKRLYQIESPRGNMRTKLVAELSTKMDKYKRAVHDVLVPKVGHAFVDEVERAGFCVRKVSEKPQGADDALRGNIVDVMDHRRIECLVLVSDDSGFLDVLNEAKFRCLKTVVVGDMSNGVLKRASDASFSWSEVLMGKAKKETAMAVGKWKDNAVLKRLGWRYDPDTDKAKHGMKNETVGDIQHTLDGDVEIEDDAENGNSTQVKGTDWWKL